jgi:diguanylate cyclase (GGDEF)-like protein
MQNQQRYKLLIFIITFFFLADMIYTGLKEQVGNPINPILEITWNIFFLVFILFNMYFLFKEDKNYKFMAHHDSLTKLPNRLQFNNTLTGSIKVAKAQQKPLTIMFIDLDRFKYINDTFGHEIGDLLLQNVAKRLRGCLRENDMVARFGGDEFVLLIKNIEERQMIAEIASRMINVLSEPFMLKTHQICITPSIGISMFPYDLNPQVEDIGSDLVKKADQAMFNAKNEGKGNYHFYDHRINDINNRKIEIENSLHRAIKRNEMDVYYQPKVDLNTGNIIGIESLLRWKSLQLGNVAPSEFIPIAEESGLIIPIGEWVLRSACQQNKAWQDAGFPPMRISVNLSIQQIKNSNIVETVKNVLKDSGLEPKYLELEITESSLYSRDRMKEILLELKKLGVFLSVDDFGTGYSSLSYLRDFPIDAIKIDRAFLERVPEEKNSAEIVKAIISFAQILELKALKLMHN